MEIEDQEGSKIQLPTSQVNKAVFGRGSGFGDGDRTVSRRHVSFQVEPRANLAGARVSFEVLGKNPIWIRRNEDDEIRVFRRSEKGELSEGDRFCVSAKVPTWFALRRTGDNDGEARNSNEEDGIEFELSSNSRIGSPLEGFDASDIDPAKEFGFVVMGHEFDRYPKHMIRDPERWDWFLEDDRKKSSDDDEEEFDQKKKKSERKKRKKGEGDTEDEDWTGGSEADEAIFGTVKKASRPKYSTRSKDRNKQPGNDAQKSRKYTQSYIAADEDDEEDEEDTTLGGFIVGDDDVKREEEEIKDVEDDEEELVEDDDEEELVEDEGDEEVDE